MLHCFPWDRCSAVNTTIVVLVYVLMRMQCNCHSITNLLINMSFSDVLFILSFILIVFFFCCETQDVHIKPITLIGGSTFLQRGLLYVKLKKKNVTRIALHWGAPAPVILHELIFLIMHSVSGMWLRQFSVAASVHRTA